MNVNLKKLFVQLSDIEIDFAPPKDYKEHEQKKPNYTQQNSGNINFSSKENKPINEKKIENEKFKGSDMRIEQKNITETQIEKIETKQKIKDVEEDNDYID